MNTQKWVTINGVVTQGYQIASGLARESSFPKGTIEMQVPFFRDLGLDLSGFFKGTLNVSIAPKTYSMQHPEYSFQDVTWASNHSAEHFSFSCCRITFKNIRHDGFIYYPSPETKIKHFHNTSILEVITHKISDIQYGSKVVLEINPLEITLD
jgi:hypothetical protein